MQDTKVLISEEKRKEINAKRKEIEKKGVIAFKENHKLVCPACEKPNTLSVTFCTGCSFELTIWYFINALIEFNYSIICIKNNNNCKGLPFILQWHFVRYLLFFYYFQEF